MREFQRSLDFAGKDEDNKDGDNDDDDDDDDNDGDDDDEDSDDVDNDDDEAVAEGMAARQVGGHEWITGHFRLKADHRCCSPNAAQCADCACCSLLLLLSS